MSTPIHVCIIGAGASGLTASKQCLDGGLRVTCYEKSDDIGGLWRYRSEDIEGQASVMKSTIINSSKEMSAFSDFPPPKHFPNYMHNSQMIEYFDAYAKEFSLREHIRFRHEVVNIEKAEDHSQTGRWKVTVKNMPTGEITGNVFDAVMVCSGHHVHPYWPEFEGQKEFLGKIIHSHSYKIPGDLEGKKVVVLGIGNSAGDIAVELSQLSPDVYLSTRRGTWIWHRVGYDGRPLDGQMLTRFQNVFRNLTSLELQCWWIERRMSERLDHELYNLLPEHRILQQHVMVNDALPNRILSGTVRVKSCIERFTQDGVIFEGESEVTKCDAVIFATGYQFRFDFFDRSIEELQVRAGNELDLYKFVFPAGLKHPETLAFIGLIQPIGSIFPIAEMQARWAVQLLKKGCPELPPNDVLMRRVKEQRALIKGRYHASARHTVQVDYVPYMIELGEQFGAKPDLWSMFFTDNKLWREVYLGPMVPYQFRLNGPDTWSKARETILETTKRIEAPLQTRADRIKGKPGLSLVVKMVLWFLISYMALVFWGMAVIFWRGLTC